MNIQIPPNLQCRVRPFIVNIQGAINHQTYLQCVKDFKRALRIPIPYLFIKIDSPGGDTQPGFKIGSLIQDAKHTKRVITIGYKVHSLASYLFSLGDVRYIDKESGSIMIHDVICSAANVHKKASVLLQEVKGLVQQANHIFETISVACGKNKQFIQDKLNKINNANMVWTPEEAQSYGFCHHVHVPSIDYIVSDKVLIDGGAPYTSTLLIRSLKPK